MTTQNKYEPILFCILLTALLLVAGCSQEPQNAIPQQGRAQNQRIYTESELNQLISSGMSQNQITNAFGPPRSTIEISEGVVRMVYLFPLNPQRSGLQLAGFSVFLKDGTVVKWLPDMGESHMSFQGRQTKPSAKELPFKLFVETDSLTNFVSVIESRGSADGFGLNMTPDLVVAAQVFAGKSGDESPDEQTVILVVSEGDVSAFSKLTKNNLGKKLLVMYRDKFVAAPTISGSVASRQLQFTVKDSVVEVLGQ